MVRTTQVRTTSHYTRYFFMQDSYAFCSSSQETNCHFESLKILKVNIIKRMLLWYFHLIIPYFRYNSSNLTTTWIFIYFHVCCQRIFFKKQLRNQLREPTSPFQASNISATMETRFMWLLSMFLATQVHTCVYVSFTVFFQYAFKVFN